LKNGWQYFYNTIVQFFRVLKPNLLQCDEMEMLEILKFYTHNGTKVEKPSQIFQKIDWMRVLMDAKLTLTA